jgi:formylglycine-generating enzyme required for sulfatase activity
VLEDLVAGLERLADGEGALLGKVEARRALAAGLQAASVGDHREEWDRAIEEVAASPAYAGLEIEPILGLVPLGRDPDSGLFEFAHVGSGTIPMRDPQTGSLAYRDDSAIVLVLLPGGSFRMGAQSADPARPNYDAGATPHERPVRRIAIRPFLIAKHECTQAQWAAMTAGERPSYYGPGSVAAGRTVGDRNPVERVSWAEARRWLSRHRLRLPSEAEWEYACRGGTDTPWITGRDASELGRVANVADLFLKEHGGNPKWDFSVEIDDGHAIHAPVGSFRPNGFGIHDMHANVGEWCEDLYAQYRESQTDGSALTGDTASPNRVMRGGGWHYVAGACRSSYRAGAPESFRDFNLGVRPAMSLP